jgi:uncharacterized protein (DUF2235 family)
MGKNMVLCFDGTSNQFGTNNTNVVRLVQVLNRDVQRLYYDPGIGTLPEPRFITRIGQRIAMAADLAFATSLTRKVQDAYRFLMDFWEPGANVYLFGFSRGAYTARVAAAMLHSLGLLSRGNHTLVPYVMRLFQSIRSDDNEETNANYWRLCNGFRQTFARQTDNDERHFRIHFLGLWDTVSSVGWVWEPLSFPFTASNPSVAVARHAVAIDERRAFFRQNLLASARTTGEQDWQELWFPGVHADVGGGYAETDGSLWLIAFDWMLREAERYGLVIDPERLQRVRNHHTLAPANPWLEPAHESLDGKWRIAEHYPKRRRTRDGSSSYRPNQGRPRFIQDGARIDQSALHRIKEGRYRPQNFSESFVKKVNALSEIPEWLPFEW